MPNTKLSKKPKKVSKQQSNKPKGPNQPVTSAAVAFSQKQQFPGKYSQLESRRIQNSELIGTVNGSQTFNLTRYPVNPGMSQTFPWLSVQATQWQQYTFHNLSFRYITRTGTDARGSVIISPDYNPTELPPTTEQQASNTMDAVEDVIWKILVCRLTKSAMFPFGPRKQIRNGAIAGDLSVYDACRLFIITTECANTDAIGKLWVDYDVELFVPQNSLSGLPSPIRTSVFDRNTVQTYTTGVPSTVKFEASTLNPLGITYDASTGIFILPRGAYMVTCNFNVSCTVAEDFTANFRIEVNGLPQTDAVFSLMKLSSFAPPNFSQSFTGLIISTGVESVTILGELTGASGTLRLLGNGTRAIFSLA